MSEEAGSLVVQMVGEEAPSFLDDGLDLKKLHQKLSKVSAQAIDVLVKALENDKDPKMQYQAALKLLDYQIDVAKAMSSDQMQRLIAEIRLRHAPKLKLIEENHSNSEASRPLVDFSTVRGV